MCGIVGFIGNKPASPVLLEGLTRLEYRGYDSAGIAVVEKDELLVVRSVGKLENLKRELSGRELDSHVGIGHTRWATHGKPSYENAHPQKSSTVTIVHNGIIENYLELKAELVAKGYTFSSETDTEVIAHLIEDNYTGLLEDAVKAAVKKLVGSFGLAVISKKEQDKVVVARNDSPLVLGVGNGEYYAASDIPAVLHHTRTFIFLEEGDVAVLTRAGYTIYGKTGARAERKEQYIDWNPVMAEKAGYKHFMQKEIFEQPRAIIDTIRGKYRLEDGKVFFGEMEAFKQSLKDIRRIVIVACGTSWHAGLVGKFYIERFARIPVEVDIASEFRYRDLILGPDTMFLAITQSGETSDTVRALRMAKEHGAKIVTVCNVVGSTMARESDGVIYTHAGPEIGVASTKAFTTQLASLFLFSLYLGQERGTLASAEAKRLLQELVELPEKVRVLLEKDGEIEELAKLFKDYSDFLFLGRNMNYPIALEGALKLKEISYIHAEGYPAGEMKHGPIALIDKDMPVFVLATKGQVMEKVVANIEEVKARDGIVIATVTAGVEEAKAKCDHVIEVPETCEELSVFTNVIVTQIFSYHTARLLGLDVDQPRNLAKSVTVE